MTFRQSPKPVRPKIRSQTNDSSPSTNTPAIAEIQSGTFVQFLSSSPNDPATSNGGGVATFWCEQCAVTTFVRLLKTRSAASIVKDWQLWAIRAWIAHCARTLKAVAPFITSAIGLGPKLMRMLEMIMVLLRYLFYLFHGQIDLSNQKHWINVIGSTNQWSYCLPIQLDFQIW